MEGPIAELKLPDRRRNVKKKPIQLTAPIIISHYSVCDEPNGKFICPDDSRFLRVIRLPQRNKNLNIDLTNGYISLADGGGIVCGSREPRLTMLLTHLSREKNRIQFPRDEGDNRPIPFDFVTYRGNLVKIMTIPYEERNDVLLVAQKYKGTIYIAKFSSFSQQQLDVERTDRHNMYAYSGFQFEKSITMPLHRHRNTKDPPKGNEYHDHFSCVLTSTLGSHSLLYAGEMDAIDRSNTYPDIDPNDFIEIKTAAIIKNDRNEEYFNRNLKTWWAQCYLSGISRVVCGFRNEQLTVKEIRNLTMNDMVRSGQNHWNQGNCLNYLNSFLTFVKKTMKDVDDPSLIYEFYWAPGDEVINCYINREPVGDNDHQVLYDWYTKEFAD